MVFSDEGELKIHRQHIYPKNNSYRSTLDTKAAREILGDQEGRKDMVSKNIILHRLIC